MSSPPEPSSSSKSPSSPPSSSPSSSSMLTRSQSKNQKNRLKQKSKNSKSKSKSPASSAPVVYVTKSDLKKQYAGRYCAALIEKFGDRDLDADEIRFVESMVKLDRENVANGIAEDEHSFYLKDLYYSSGNFRIMSLVAFARILAYNGGYDNTPSDDEGDDF